MPEEAFKDRVRAARGKLLQTEAAAKWGVSLRALQSWEQGYREPKGIARTAVEKLLKKAGV